MKEDMKKKKNKVNKKWRYEIHNLIIKTDRVIYKMWIINMSDFFILRLNANMVNYSGETSQIKPFKVEI